MESQVKFFRSGSTVRASAPDEIANAFAGLLGIGAGPDAFHRALEKLAGGADAPGSFSEHFAYYLKVLKDENVHPVEVWSEKGTKVGENGLEFLQRYLPEFISRVRTAALGMQEVPPPAAQGAVVNPTLFIFEQLQQRASQYSSPKFRDHVPFSVLGLPSEANLSVLYPAFETSLATPGDVAEFGCFRGVTSLKMAFLIKALGLDKTVYAFDTFEGFQISDPGGGALGVGAFADNHDSFHQLELWGQVLPIKPIKGDATKTCAVLQKPLSFVWLDLDMGVLMDPVLKTIWPQITADTLIGIDDVGRPETPTVEPWVDEIVASGLLKEVSRDNSAFIRFFRKA